jgi:hypothetical protein
MMFAIFKTSKWNREPEQKKLAAMLMEAGAYEATGGIRGTHLDIREVIAFTTACGWRDKEASDRFVHAVSMIRPIADIETYEAARTIAHNLYQAYRA